MPLAGSDVESPVVLALKKGEVRAAGSDCLVSAHVNHPLWRLLVAAPDAPEKAAWANAMQQPRGSGPTFFLVRF